METPIQPTQPQSPISATPNSKPKIIIAALSVAVVAILGVGLYLWQKPLTNETPPTQQSAIPVIIYTQQVKESGTRESRSWPTVKILRKIGDAEPETLAEIGKVGEYPNSYQLSPDKKFLLINLESKLQILDLTTKELKDLFIPKRQVLSTSYSPDRTQLFIWDQEYAPRDGDNSYYVHRFTISSRKDEILKQGVSESSFFGQTWREDNKVVLNEARGEFSSPHHFDLASNQIIKTPGYHASGLLSESGKAMAVEGGSIDDICNYFSGDASSAYDVIDPVSGKILGTVGLPNNRVEILAFSPNDTEAFYQAEKPWTNREDCNKIAEKTYFKVQIATNQATQINNPAELLSSWNGNYVGAITSYDDEKRIWSILVNGQSVVTSSAELNIAGQYYKGYLFLGKKPDAGNDGLPLEPVTTSSASSVKNQAPTAMQRLMSLPLPQGFERIGETEIPVVSFILPNNYESLKNDDIGDDAFVVQVLPVVCDMAYAQGEWQISGVKDAPAVAFQVNDVPVGYIWSAFDGMATVETDPQHTHWCIHQSQPNMDIDISVTRPNEQAKQFIEETFIPLWLQQSSES